MAAKTRINITFDLETLRLADREARRHKTSRSNLIRTAVRAFASERERQQTETARQQRQSQAAATMDRLARKAGNWPAVEILHAWRYRLQGGKK
jgi:metal-responsive CopG/Arc/MetJ family transcriptional regulator